jgi:hypothetical protein
MINKIMKTTNMMLCCDVGDVSSENCDSEKRAKFIASRLCSSDDTTIVVYDSSLCKIFIKDVSKCNPPVSHIIRLSIVTKNTIDKIGME